MKRFVLSIILTLFLFSTETATAQGPACPSGQVMSVVGGVFTCITPGTCANQSDVKTALGCIPTEPQDLVKWILGWSIAMGGGIAFLLSLWGGVTVILAGGNPEKINEGKEIITSAISGLLFIIFSIFLLRLIGVNILGIF